MAALWDFGVIAVLCIPGAMRIRCDLYWLRALSHHPGLDRPMDIGDDPDERCVTLILCAHNDLDALQTVWSSWRGQAFPAAWQVEWLVVNDGSTDGTAEWLDRMVEGDDKLTVVHHIKQSPGKKVALAAGIVAARYDRLVLTDADCRPGRHWAHHMAASLADTDVVLGVCLSEGGPGLLRFDALRVALQYCGEAVNGKAYMGVGRSMAYRRSTWSSIGGFERHADLASGDDDLFVQDAQRMGIQVGLCPAPGKSTRIVTLPAAGIRDGWQRKRRHLSTSDRYSPSDRARLALDSSLDILTVLCAVAGVFGLLHRGGWIPVVAMMLAFLVRAITLSSFSRVWGNDGPSPLGMAFWGPIRWIFLASATLVNAFTSSPKWTQRAPTSRS